jgi:siroheme synthase-like protein
MKLYPIFANIENKLAIVIGGGEVAYRKVKDLSNARARIKIISPEIQEKIKALKKKDHSIEIINREYRQGDLNGAFLVFAATNNNNVNRLIFNEASERGILINSADDPDNCSFYVPSMIRKGDLIVAVSTSGTSPAMAARLSNEFKDVVPDNIDEILLCLNEVRSILKSIDGLSPKRRSEILISIVNDNNMLSELILHKEKGTIKEMTARLVHESGDN